MKPKFALPPKLTFCWLPCAANSRTVPQPPFLPVYHSPLPHHTQRSTSTPEASIDISGTEPKKYEHFFKARSVSPISSCAQRMPPWTMISKGMTWTPRKKGSWLIHLLCGRTGTWRQGEPERNCSLSFNSVNLVGDSMVWVSLLLAFPQLCWLPFSQITQLCARRCHLMS